MDCNANKWCVRVKVAACRKAGKRRARQELANVLLGNRKKRRKTGMHDILVVTCKIGMAILVAQLHRPAAKNG